MYMTCPIPGAKRREKIQCKGNKGIYKGISFASHVKSSLFLASMPARVRHRRRGGRGLRPHHRREEAGGNGKARDRPRQARGRPATALSKRIIARGGPAKQTLPPLGFTFAGRLIYAAKGLAHTPGNLATPASDGITIAARGG